MQKNTGSLALLKNYEKNISVRVFRSSQLNSVFAPAAQYIAKTRKHRATYRYDGIYSVDSILYLRGECLLHPKSKPNMEIMFKLNRNNPEKKITSQKRNKRDDWNNIGIKELLDIIYKK